MWAYAFQGAKRLILGSDYPHVIGNIEGSISSIHDLEIPDKEKEWSFSEDLNRY